MRREKRLEISVLELEGNARKIGLQQGKRLKWNSVYDKMLSSQKHVNAEEAVYQLKEFSPAFLRELTGLSEGFVMKEEIVVKLFSGYNVDMPAMGCSAFANENYYVRNYDFSDQLYDARLIFQKPSSGYASVGFSQQILGRLDGMNERGLVIGLHFVNEEFIGDGFLATTICRLILDQCATTEEAIALIKKLPQRYCYNYSILDINGETAIVEATPNKQLVYRSDSLACTNHFEFQIGKNKKGIMFDSSKKRKEEIAKLNSAREDTLNSYKQFNSKSSPLFFNRYEEFFGTLHTVVYHPKELSLIVGVGRDCEPYHFSFKNWLRGKEELPSMLFGNINVES